MISYIHFNRNYASILYGFRVTARYLSKVAYFDLSHLHLSPQFGVTLFEFCLDLWHQQTRVPVLLCGVVCVILITAVLIQYQSVANIHTDRHTTMAYTMLA